MMKILVPAPRQLQSNTIKSSFICGKLFKRNQTILASEIAKALVKRDEKDVEHVPKYPGSDVPLSHRYTYPEFLPYTNWKYRNRTAEAIERMDMLKRRSVIDIPEFYVGCIMRVVCSDPFSATKTNRFVGICISRGGVGLRAFMILRNVVEGHGVEVTYNLYNPTIRSIETLKMERRVDDELLYLRDAPEEYSTVPQNFEKIPHPSGVPVPLNETIVPLKKPPWVINWHLYPHKGFSYEENAKQEKERKAFTSAQDWEKHDVIKKYRRSIVVEEQAEIFASVSKELQDLKKKTKLK